MLECKSMYFGGEIISALDLGLDYDSYREMGLLCPFCNEPVYLCGETVRQNSKTGRLSYIQPHFRHFPGGDPLELTCEKRYLSPEGKRYLDAIRSDRKGQRLDLFNRYFLSMVGLSSATYYQKLIKRKWLVDYDWDMKYIHEIWSEDKSDLLKAATRRVEWMFQCGGTVDPGPSCLEHSGLSHAEKEEAQALASQQGEKIVSMVDMKVHALIVCEALEFLSTKKGYPSFLSIAWHSLFGAFATQGITFANWSPDEQIDRITSLAISLLIITDWQQQLEEKAKIKESTRAKGFGRK